MKVICSKSGQREKCGICEHSSPHAFSLLRGCEMGRCFPDTEERNTINGDIIMTQQHLPCIEIPIQEEKKHEQAEILGDCPQENK